MAGQVVALRSGKTIAAVAEAFTARPAPTLRPEWTTRGRLARTSSGSCFAGRGISI
jgi:hypothetical protein